MGRDLSEIYPLCRKICSEISLSIDVDTDNEPEQIWLGILDSRCKIKHMSTSKVLVGFLVGAAVGGALGILLAPDKGEETRRKILEKGNDIGDSLSDLGDTIKGKFNDMVDGVKENFGKAKNSAV
jgi:hypothetical protein